MSLRARVLLGTAVIAVVLLTSALAITRTTRQHLIGQVDDQLVAAQPRLLGGPGGGMLDDYQRTGNGDGETARLSTLYVGLLGTEGGLATVVLPNLQTDAEVQPQLTREQIEALRDGRHVSAETNIGDRYRLAADREVRGGALLVLGLSLADVDEAVRRLVFVELVAVLIIAAVLALVTWWVIRLGVRPVRQMTAAATEIAEGDLSRRVPEAVGGTEAGALGAALNGMLSRIEGAFAQREASEEKLRQFVADASHELRTPVTTIRGYAEMYRRGALDERPELDEAMRRTEAEAVRMGTLVDDLLRLARLDQGRELARQPVDLAVVARDAVRDGRARAPERTMLLEAADGSTVIGDEDGLRQVTANLISNALIHAPDATIRVSVASGVDGMALTVADDGPGMTESDRARALERFYRADASRSRAQGGSGLGLSIVDAIAQAHGGSVTVTSAPGRGTTVTVTLPAA